ncbi:hypothetical protein yc1106_04136 [Curvularia clavata]|uniref:Uncharacterized protein n=1 Tax=Curvularia clavata TaxID=95742 RepID=A0A9Q8Z746_CURCL|nr:hypothetical protein yc1106_04136 [Curvularia clavata]
MNQIFGPLPAELLLNVFDQLIQTHGGHRPVPYPHSDIVTKTLRSLTLVSRGIYPIATKYLYSTHIWLSSTRTFSRFCTTLQLNRQRQVLTDDVTVQQKRGFAQFDLSQYVASVYISPLETEEIAWDPWDLGRRLPAIVDLCRNLSSTLKRLHLNLSPIVDFFTYTRRNELEEIERNMFPLMLCLEELMISSEVIYSFRLPPPNLRRLAVANDDFGELESAFCLSLQSLETLVLFRPLGFSANMIESLFDSYRGKSLDIILFENNFNHGTPQGTRDWTPKDTVRIWEADVPLSFYGDDDPSALCHQWMWDQGTAGTLWSQTQRRMMSWSEIQKRLAGPVHSIMDTPPSQS